MCASNVKNGGGGDYLLFVANMVELQTKNIVAISSTRYLKHILKQSKLKLRFWEQGPPETDNLNL